MAPKSCLRKIDVRNLGAKFESETYVDDSQGKSGVIRFLSRESPVTFMNVHRNLWNSFNSFRDKTRFGENLDESILKHS